MQETIVFGVMIFLLQPGQGHDDLENGTRGIDALQELVLEGLARVAADRQPLLTPHLPRENLGVEGRFADLGQDAARLQVDDAHGAALAHQELLDVLLQLEVEGKDNRVADLRA